MPYSLEDLDPPVVRIYYARREVISVGVGVCQDDGKVTTSHSGAEAGGGHVDADLKEVEADQCRAMQNEGSYESGVDGREECEETVGSGNDHEECGEDQDGHDVRLGDVGSSEQIESADKQDSVDGDPARCEDAHNEDERDEHQQ